MKNLRPLPCWEFMNCEPARRWDCPAFKADLGHLCWAVVGSKRDPLFGGSTLRRMGHCQACAFYRIRNGHGLGGLH